MLRFKNVKGQGHKVTTSLSVSMCAIDAYRSLAVILLLVSVLSFCPLPPVALFIYSFSPLRPALNVSKMTSFVSIIIPPFPLLPFVSSYPAPTISLVLFY